VFPWSPVTRVQEPIDPYGIKTHRKRWGREIDKIIRLTAEESYPAISVYGDNVGRISCTHTAQSRGRGCGHRLGVDSLVRKEKNPGLHTVPEARRHNLLSRVQLETTLFQGIRKGEASPKQPPVLRASPEPI